LRRIIERPCKERNDDLKLRSYLEKAEMYLVVSLYPGAYAEYFRNYAHHCVLSQIIKINNTICPFFYSYQLVIKS
jgi:hypothetical protein